MPSRSSGSTVVRRRLGHALRNLREDANIRIEAAARELECSTAKISRLENGLGPAKKLEVRALLDLYGVDDADRRAEFDRWADGTKAAGWWESDADVVEDYLARFFAVETESVLLRMFCTPVLPTILQSPDYNLAHVHDLYPEMTPSDTLRLAHLRQSRRKALLDPNDPLKLIAVVDEGAIWRQVGSPRLHAEALLWLADILDGLADSGRNDVDFRVLPFSAGTPDWAMSSFTLLSPREADVDPVTAYVEDSAGARLYESEEDVSAMSAMFDRLLGRCIAPHASRLMLRRVATRNDHRSLPRQSRDERLHEGNSEEP
jgi:transcriptional regulator with XRE-family HTH domain